MVTKNILIKLTLILSICCFFEKSIFSNELIFNNTEKYNLGINQKNNSDLKDFYADKSTEVNGTKSKTDSESGFFLWGKPGKDAVYLGMWSFHLSLLVNQGAEENWQHDLLAVAYSGFIAGTFINSFHDRCYVFALHRSLYRTGDKNGFSTDLGYNLGVVKGYDGRLISIADELKYLPFFQVTYDISWKMLGLQLSYVGTVLTAGFYIEYEI
ncbi:hypothetical protein ACWNT8_01555 [Pigmentibacter ruber]|nr:hypothetical protein GTC16762_05810 [Pigmentibacter ruber]